MKLSSLALTEAEQQQNQIEQVALQGLAMSMQSHIWHWQTKSFAAHTALGEFYNTVRDAADAVAEQYMGCGHEIQSQISCSIVPFSDAAVKTKLSEFKKVLLSVESPIMNDENNEYHGVADTIITLIQAVDKLSYLLTLK